MSEHTLGKLYACELDSAGWVDIVTTDPDGTRSLPFIACKHHDPEANARRLVACWNACEGLDTDQIESMVNVPEFFFGHMDLLRERDSLRAVNAELLEALEKALPFMEAESVISGYGFYRPSNPNDFHPDHESCSEDEIAAHKAACEAYDAGTYNDNYGGGWVGPGLHILKAPWGIGSYTDTIPELEAQCEKARAAIASARKQGEQG